MRAAARGLGARAKRFNIAAVGPNDPAEAKGKTMLKTLVIAAAIAAVPAAALAQTALPKCTAKLQDSCDQSMTTEKNAIDHYPAETRDAGNNKIGKASAMPARSMKPTRRSAKKIMPMNAAATPGDPAEAMPAK